MYDYSRTHAARSVTVSCAKRSKQHGFCLSNDSLKRLSTNRVENGGVFYGGNLEIQVVEFGGGLLSLRIFEGTARQNSKGCDIGYALAAGSCEEANSVEACTVTALDAITAFAVPNPNCSSQSKSVFSGPVALRVAPFSRSPSLLRTGKVFG